MKSCLAGHWCSIITTVLITGYDRGVAPSSTTGQEGKNSLNISFWAGYAWDIRDPDVRISWTTALCKWPCSVVLDREWPGCPGIWVGKSRIWKNFMQENFGLIFRTPTEQQGAEFTMTDSSLLRGSSSIWGAFCSDCLSQDQTATGSSH